jgi:hypothetical protein
MLYFLTLSGHLSKTALSFSVRPRAPTQPADRFTICNPYAPWCWYIYLQNWVIFRVNVGKYSSTMVRIWVGLIMLLGVAIQVDTDSPGEITKQDN